MNNNYNMHSLRVFRHSCQSAVSFAFEMENERARQCATGILLAWAEADLLKKTMSRFMRDKMYPIQRKMKEAFYLRKRIREYVRARLEDCKLKLLETSQKKNKGLQKTLKSLKKLDEDTVARLAEILYKVFMLRHQCKMIWHSVNAADNPEEVKLEELPEDVVQATLRKKEGDKQLALAREETLDFYIEKLTQDQKIKDELKEPIRKTKDFACRKSTFMWHCHIKHEVSNDLGRHLLEKCCSRKGAAKKLKEITDRENEIKLTYFAFLKSRAMAIKRN